MSRALHSHILLPDKQIATSFLFYTEAQLNNHLGLQGHFTCDIIYQHYFVFTTA